MAYTLKTINIEEDDKPTIERPDCIQIGESPNCAYLLFRDHERLNEFVAQLAVEMSEYKEKRDDGGKNIQG